MKRFKEIDLLVSCLLIAIFIILSLTRLDTTFIIGYFTVGGWQLISMLVHAYNHWFTKKRGRRFIYHWISFTSLATMPIGSFWILLFTAPVMALYYTWLCYEEVYIKMQRPITLLKN